VSGGLDEKRRIVAAVEDVHIATVQAMRRVREEGQRQLEPLRQACAESGGHVFSAGRDPAGRACVFCGAPEPQDALETLARHLKFNSKPGAAS
jgi:hypothetical protein